MSDRFEVDTDNFHVELNDDVAELVFGSPGSVPFADGRGHRELYRVWSRLDEHPAVRLILVRSEGKGFCAGGTIDVVKQMVSNEAAPDGDERSQSHCPRSTGL
jgi:enoyl-CoA hydratase